MRPVPSDCPWQAGKGVGAQTAQAQAHGLCSEVAEQEPKGGKPTSPAHPILSYHHTGVNQPIGCLPRLLTVGVQ